MSNYSYTVETLILETRILADVIGDILFYQLENTGTSQVETDDCEKILSLQLLLQERTRMLSDAFQKAHQPAKQDDPLDLGRELVELSDRFSRIKAGGRGA